MAIVTEDYVSFEIAKLLKEKGFCENTEHKIWYVIKQFSTGCNWNSCTYKVGDITREYNDDCCIPMPTLQMAMKWLREVHNIHVVPKFDFYAGYYTGRIYDGRRESAVENEDYMAVVGNRTYEQASEEAIKYTIENLIWVIMTYEEKKQVYIDKITNRLGGKSLETLKKLYDIMTNLY